LQNQLIFLGLKIKKGIILYVTFIHSDPGNAKADKSRENETKTRRSRIEPGQKRVVNHILDIIS
jgi:IS5 family transposase